MTDRKFDYFVVLAGMRTGSNLLEEQLAAMPGIVSHGELFNPHFFGKPEMTSKWDLSIQARNADPVRGGACAASLDQFDHSAEPNGRGR